MLLEDWFSHRSSLAKDSLSQNPLSPAGIALPWYHTEGEGITPPCPPLLAADRSGLNPQHDPGAAV